MPAITKITVAKLLPQSQFGKHLLLKEKQEGLLELRA